MSPTFAIYPDALPLDERGCRIHEAYLATPAEQARTGITAVYAVHCHGTPVTLMTPCPLGPHP